MESNVLRNDNVQEPCQNFESYPKIWNCLSHTRRDIQISLSVAMLDGMEK